MQEKAIVGVVGAGLMGVGIATQFARAGYRVILQEVSAARRTQLPGIVAGILDELSAAGQVDARARAAVPERLVGVNDLAALAPAVLVIEAIPEQLPLKQALFGQLEAILPAHAILASNTSGFLPDALAASLKDPSRFLVTHFWNPPHAIPLVEVVPATATHPAVVEAVMTRLQAIGMEPVRLEKAIPGFIGNRLQFAILREALHIVQSGAASPEEVDRVMKASLGRRYGFMGPFEVADQGGLDTFLAISTHLMPALAQDMQGLEVLRQKVARQELGARTGQGFYHWTPARQDALRRARRRGLLAAPAPDETA